jgi:hypothetical protein
MQEERGCRSTMFGAVLLWPIVQEFARWVRARSRDLYIEWDLVRQCSLQSLIFQYEHCEICERRSFSIHCARKHKPSRLSANGTECSL